MAFAADAIRVSQEPDPPTGDITVPINQTSTFVQEGLGKHKGHEYAPTSNPMRTAHERGRLGLAFAPGMAAINALRTLFKTGDHTVAGNNV